MKKLFWPAFWVAAVVMLITSQACKHQPYLDIDGTGYPIDTTTAPIDTVPIPVDTTPVGIVCDPDTVYFENTILPLLQSSCAVAGCHDAITHAEGYNTTDYAHIMNKVKPFFPTQSGLYKSLITNDSEERMPRPPVDAFTQEQINLIKKWIEQGALNNSCNEGATGCDTTNIQFSTYVWPVIVNKCKGCHSGSSPSGSISLTNYNQVKAVGLNGKLYGSIAQQNGYVAMPSTGNKLSDCQISKIKAWIDAGMPNN